MLVKSTPIRISCHFQIDIIQTSSPSFYLNASIKADFDKFLYIGESYNQRTNMTEGSAKFVIDYATAPVFKLLVDIDAAIYIPTLRIWGMVSIHIM